MPSSFAVLSAMGRPVRPRAGESGLMHIMKNHLRSGTQILLDDVHRQEEQQLAGRWATELAPNVRFSAAPRMYARLTVR